MKFCQPHWEQLKEEVRAQELWEHVSKSGQEAAARTASGKIEDIDPLMHAYLLCVQQAINKYGPGVTVDNPDGTEPCPICVHCAACARTWIKGSVAETKDQMQGAVKQ